MALSYFDYNAPADQLRPEARAPKREYDATRELQAAAHASLTEKELAQFIAASIAQARRAKGRK